MVRAMKRLHGPTRLPDPGGYAHAPVDPIRDGTDRRQRVLDDHPFLAALAPRGFRFGSDTADFDGKETHGRTVRFDGPDDRDTISYSPRPMTADEIYESSRDTTVDFAKAGNTDPGFLEVENLGPRSYRAAYHVPSSPPQNGVTCTAALDGMEVTADSTNNAPRRGSLEAAIALLRAGVEHWKAIRD